MLRPVAAILLLAAGSAAAASVAGTVTLRCAGLVVELDAALPRPLTALHQGLQTPTNFTAPAAAAPAPPASEYTASVAPGLCSPTLNVGVDAKGGDKPLWGTGTDVPRVNSSAACCAICKNHTGCKAWTWNGPGGNHYCYGYSGCTKTQHARANSQMTGSDQPVPKPAGPSPAPPSPPGPGPPPSGPFPSSVACISVIAANGSSDEYCAGRGEAATTYTVNSASNASWSTVLTKPGAATVTLAGSAATLDSNATLSGNAAELVWVLDTAVTSAAGHVVRAIDLGFGFLVSSLSPHLLVVYEPIKLQHAFGNDNNVGPFLTDCLWLQGLPSAGDQHYTTHQSKSWCPPSTGCQEWHGVSSHAICLCW